MFDGLLRGSGGDFGIGVYNLINISKRRNLSCIIHDNKNIIFICKQLQNCADDILYRETKYMYYVQTTIMCSPIIFLSNSLHVLIPQTI